MGMEDKMKNVFKKIDGVKTGIFAAGVLFGTAGIKILSSQDAKKVYTNCTEAVLRARQQQQFRRMLVISMRRLRLSTMREKQQKKL